MGEGGRDGGGEGGGILHPTPHPHKHAAGSVRHAEKRRCGTCPFANRIASTSLSAYEDAVPASYVSHRRSGTCVSAILAHFRHLDDDDDDVEEEEEVGGDGVDGNDSSGGRRGGDGGDDGRRRRRLQVMGLGVGTKYLSRAVLREEEEEEEGGGGGRRRNYGERVRDCHAEVLARRAFLTRISLEMASGASSAAGLDDNGRRTTGEYVPILERVDDDDDDDDGGGGGVRRRAASEDEAEADGGGGGGGSGRRRIRYRLRDGVTLHYYCSSAPCELLVRSPLICTAEPSLPPPPPFPNPDAPPPIGTHCPSNACHVVLSTDSFVSIIPP
jgi:hypothetical protein